MRAHFWWFILNSEGEPIENCDVYIYEAGTLNLATLYFQETGGSSDSSGHLITNGAGYFEFWLADSSEVGGYERTKKFKISWEKAGVAEGFIDYIDVFPPGEYDGVDETDLNGPGATEKNKLLSNYLATLWENHRNSTFTPGVTGASINPHELYMNTDGTLTGVTDNEVPTSLAVKTYIDTKVYSVENLDVDNPTTVVDTFNQSLGKGCIWHYVVNKVGNLRAGTITAVWYNTTVQFTHTYTSDIGNTAEISFTPTATGTSIVLTATCSTDNWEFRARRIII